MPLKVFIKPGDTTDGYKPEFSILLQQAFSEWADASQRQASFILTNNPRQAQIICGWTSDKNDMTKLTEGGHALLIPDGHNIKEVQITILTKTPSGADLSDKYFKRVALHEVGHALGLVNHSPNPHDMMFGNPLTSGMDCTLTARDKNTLVALYSIDKSQAEHSALNVAGMLPEQDNQSNLARIIRLNAEAAQAVQNKNLAVAVSKLEEAHQIDPNNDLINRNLGAVYGNCALVACLIKDNKRAQTYFDQAIPLLAKSGDRKNYLSVLGNYQNFLQMNNKNDEAAKVAAKLKALSTH